LDSFGSLGAFFVDRAALAGFVFVMSDPHFFHKMKEADFP
jgi:hypothetical protein